MRNRPIPDMSAEDRDFARSLVIYEDEAILAFNKPPGLPVQSRGNKARCLDNLLWAFARTNGKRPRLVHRLDAGTSGLIIAAKTQPVAAHLSAAFEARKVQKTYLAVVKGGLISGEEGVIDAPLLKRDRSANGAPAQTLVSDGCNDPHAKPARTNWKVVSHNDECALVEARPETGRMHQIRVHLSHLGHPILGDQLYGKKVQASPRLMLHAWRLQIPQADGVMRALEAPVPEAFAKISNLSPPGQS